MGFVGCLPISCDLETLGTVGFGKVVRLPTRLLEQVF